MSILTMENRVAVVTGAGSGNGRAIALRLAEAGAHVVLGDVNLEGAQQTEALIAQAGGKAVAVRADVTSEESVAALIDVAVGLGGPHAVVAQAGVTVRGAVAELSLEDWNRLMAVDVTGTFLTVKKAVQAMIPLGGGSIVTMSGAFAYWSLPGTAAYAAAKGAILAFTRTVAAEYGDRGIRCNTIVPGYIATNMVSTFLDSRPERDKAAQDVENWHALGRIADPDEVAKTALFLCSDASSFSTGSPFFVDGGLVLGVNANTHTPS